LYKRQILLLLCRHDSLVSFESFEATRVGQQVLVDERLVALVGVQPVKGAPVHGLHETRNFNSTFSTNF
jgi:hypothetical protein